MSITKLTNAASVWSAHVTSKNRPTTSAFTKSRGQVCFLTNSEEMQILGYGKSSSKALWSVFVGQNGEVKNIVKYVKRSGLKGMFNNLVEVPINYLKKSVGVNTEKNILAKANQILKDVLTPEYEYVAVITK